MPRLRLLFSARVRLRYEAFEEDADASKRKNRTTKRNGEKKKKKNKNKEAEGEAREGTNGQGTGRRYCKMRGSRGPVDLQKQFKVSEPNVMMRTTRASENSGMLATVKLGCLRDTTSRNEKTLKFK